MFDLLFKLKFKLESQNPAYKVIKRKTNVALRKRPTFLKPSIARMLQSCYLHHPFSLTHKQFFMFLGFPEYCSNYYGPHSLDCLRSIWKKVGCSLFGLEEPGKLDLENIKLLQSMNLRYVHQNKHLSEEINSDYLSSAPTR